MQKPRHYSRKPRHIMESNQLARAELLLASKSIVDELQKLLEKISKLQVQDLPIIVDRIKIEFNLDQAEEYRNQATLLLQHVVDNVASAKDGIDNLTLGLTGDVDMSRAQPDMHEPAAQPNTQDKPSEHDDSQLDHDVDAELARDDAGRTAPGHEDASAVGRRRKQHESASRSGRMLREQKKTVKYPQVHVELAGQDGNIFSILGRCMAAAKRQGVPQKELDLFRDHATAGDYDHAFRTCMAWFNCDKQELDEQVADLGHSEHTPFDAGGAGNRTWIVTVHPRNRISEYFKVRADTREQAEAMIADRYRPDQVNSITALAESKCFVVEVVGKSKNYGKMKVQACDGSQAKKQARTIIQRHMKSGKIAEAVTIRVKPLHASEKIQQIQDMITVKARKISADTRCDMKTAIRQVIDGNRDMIARYIDPELLLQDMIAEAKTIKKKLAHDHAAMISETYGNHAVRAHMAQDILTMDQGKLKSVLHALGLHVEGAEHAHDIGQHDLERALQLTTPVVLARIDRMIHAIHEDNTQMAKTVQPVQPVKPVAAVGTAGTAKFVKGQQVMYQGKPVTIDAPDAQGQVAIKDNAAAPARTVPVNQIQPMTTGTAAVTESIYSEKFIAPEQLVAALEQRRLVKFSIYDFLPMAQGYLGGADAYHLEKILLGHAYRDVDKLALYRIQEFAESRGEHVLAQDIAAYLSGDEHAALVQDHVMQSDTHQESSAIATHNKPQDLLRIARHQLGAKLTAMIQQLLAGADPQDFPHQDLDMIQQFAKLRGEQALHDVIDASINGMQAVQEQRRVSKPVKIHVEYASGRKHNRHFVNESTAKSWLINNADKIKSSHRV